MADIICVNCMKGIMNTSGICTICGKTDEQIETSRRHLPLRCILRGKYLIGKVIGEGGFGITYLGYDLDLEIRVAIKEFCPRDFAGRDADDRLTILPFDKESAEFFEAEKEKFINEAKRLAKFRGEQGIVSVLDYFQENGTAYIVMEYIEGVTLKKFQKMVGGTMEPEQLMNLIKPVMEGLSKLHANNIIHRDISPDNIMIDASKQKVYLIDFGTAREVSPNEEHSLSVYKKGGYTPIEQQSRHGKQGPWTDVYALCATIYRCITGTSIPEVNNRIMGDEVVRPSDMGIVINPWTEEALFHGLEVKPEERTQSMAELMTELYERDNFENEEILMWEEELEETVEEASEKETYEQEVKEGNDSKKSISKFVLIFIAILAFLIWVPLGIELMSGSDNNTSEAQEDIQTTGMETKSEEKVTPTEDSKQEAIEEQKNSKPLPEGIVELEEDDNGRVVKEVHEDGMSVFYEYKTDKTYTVTKKDAADKILEIERYKNKELKEKSTYSYETDDNYLITIEVLDEETGEYETRTEEYVDGLIAKRIYTTGGVTTYEHENGRITIGRDDGGGISTYDYISDDEYIVTSIDKEGVVTAKSRHKDNQTTEMEMYYPNGQIGYKYIYMNGQSKNWVYTKEGMLRRYSVENEDGTGFEVKYDDYYKEGEPNSYTREEFDADGVLVKKEVYKDGQLVE